MNIDWNKIKKEYPKGYDLFLKSGIAIENCDNELQKAEYNKFGHIEELCYCDIEKFFDDNGVIIIINKLVGWNKGWSYNVRMINKSNFHLKTYAKCNYIKTRDEAKEQAIYKAFEILEKNSR
jgi:hypothetical protein